MISIIEVVTTLATFQGEGCTDQALAYISDVLEEAKRELGSRHADVGILLTLYGTRMGGKRDFLNSEIAYREALEIFDSLSDPPPQYLGECLNNLASVLSVQKHNDEAITYIQRALVVTESIYGEEHPGTVMCMKNSAKMLIDAGKGPDAELLYRRAINIQDRISSPTHPVTVKCLHELGKLLAKGKRDDEAEPFLRRALLVLDRGETANQSTEFEVLFELAALFNRAENFDEAIPLFRRLVALGESLMGDENPGFVGLIRILAKALESNNEFGHAEEEYRRALLLQEKNFGSEDVGLIEDLCNLADIMNTQGNIDEVEKILFRAAEIALKNESFDRRQASMLFTRLALVSLQQDNSAHAVSWMQRAVLAAEKEFGADSLDFVPFLFTLANIIKTSPDNQQAAVYYTQILSVCEKHKGNAILDSPEFTDMIDTCGKYLADEEH